MNLFAELGINERLQVCYLWFSPTHPKGFN